MYTHLLTYMHIYKSALLTHLYMSADMYAHLLAYMHICKSALLTHLLAYICISADTFICQHIADI